MKRSKKSYESSSSRSARPSAPKRRERFFFVPEPLRLKDGDAAIVRKGHPWLFADVLSTASALWENGQAVDLQDKNGQHLAYGIYEADNKLAIRVCSKTRVPSVEYFTKAFRRCLELRHGLDKVTTAVRLCHGENDGVPGINVDRYANYLVLLLDGTFLKSWEPFILQALVEVFNPQGILRRYQGRVTKTNNPDYEPKLIYGDVPHEIKIQEYGIEYQVNPFEGSKTGFFIDQREARFFIRKHCKNKTVLNCFSYTGGFGLNALKGEALKVANVDLSKQATENARHNLALNQAHLPAESKCVFITADVLKYLGDSKPNSFDLVILDPPAFASNKENVANALKAYHHLHKLALPLVKHGGTLLTCSCSRRVSDLDFSKQVRAAARDLSMSLTLIESIPQPKDHPTRNSFPEGRYLKAHYYKVEK